MSEPGLDIHQWETRWADLQEQAADAPDEALPELVRLVEEMLTERGFDLENPVVEEGQDAPTSSGASGRRGTSRGRRRRLGSSGRTWTRPTKTSRRSTLS